MNTYVSYFNQLTAEEILASPPKEFDDLNISRHPIKGINVVVGFYKLTNSEDHRAFIIRRNDLGQRTCLKVNFVYVMETDHVWDREKSETKARTRRVIKVISVKIYPGYVDPELITPRKDKSSCFEELPHSVEDDLEVIIAAMDVVLGA